MALLHHIPVPEQTSGAHSEKHRLNVDLFRKLGYSTADVEAAFRKLQPDSDTNAVLGELLRIGARISSSDSEERSAGVRNSLLPPSWISSSTTDTAQKKSTDDPLRPIVIDGSNVAMSHGNKTIFSCRGIQLAVNFFLNRGHRRIKVIVPLWRKEKPRPDTPIRDQYILAELEERNILAYTPSRNVGGKRVVCYDDRYILEVATVSEGVIVSNDNYRDLQGERPDWKKSIEERLLMYSFVNDKFMPPDDPLGRHGPTLDNFLRKNPLPEQSRLLCPYGKKCTYGNKCRYYHPERTNRPYISVADELRKKAQNSSHNPASRSSPKSSLTATDSSKVLQVSENVPVYREAPGSVQNHVQAQSEWALSSHHYSSGSQERLDSGLGSYDSLNNSPWTWPQQNSMTQTSQGQQFNIHIDDSEYGRYTYAQNAHNSAPNNGSFPGYIQYTHPDQGYNSAPHLDHRVWSYPAPPQVKTSLPIMLNQYNYSAPQFNPWALEQLRQQQQRHQPPSFMPGDPRMELRSKLQAIFNPADVDRAMEMFPMLTDSERLAEEIVRLKRGMMF